MDEDIRSLIEAIHATPEQAVVALAGAGSEALACLLSVPGASRTLLEALVPYGRNSMIDFLGHEPEQYVSSRNARDMAKAAYARALTLREGDEPALGLGCTATLVTDRPQTWRPPLLRGNMGPGDGIDLQSGAAQEPARPDWRRGRQQPVGVAALAEASKTGFDIPSLLTDGDRLEVAHWGTLTPPSPSSTLIPRVAYRP